LSKRFEIPVVLFSMMFLALLATFPDANASTVFPTRDGTEQASLNAIVVSSSTVYPISNVTTSTVYPPLDRTEQGSLNALLASSRTQYTSGYCYYWNDGSCYPYYHNYYRRYYPSYYSYYYYPYSYAYDYYPYYYSYYYPTTSPETTKTFELKVTTNPSGIVPVSGAGTYNQGTVASFSLTSSIVPTGANERYVFSNWGGDFSGGTPSGTITMDSAKTVVANYQLENYLKVAIDPPGITGSAGEGWYNSGESVMVGAVPPLIPGGQGIRYVFDHWTVDAVPVSANPVQVTMDTPHTVVAHYKTQYLLTVDSEYGYAQGGGWYDAGSSATLSVTAQVDTSYGVRQVFDRWTGDFQSTSPVATVTIDSPVAVRAAWRTDSTVLYATIALAIAAAFALGIGLTAIAIRRQQQQAKPVPSTEAKSVQTGEEEPKKLRPARTSKRVRAPPKPSAPEESPAA
jgi:hypothetical protein